MVQPSARPRESRIDRLSQRTRRLMAVGTLVGLPAMYAWSSLWQATSVPTLTWGWVSFLLVGMTGVGSLVLYRYVRDRAEWSSRGLDERQQQLRDRSLVLSYGILATVVVMAIGVVAVLVLAMGRQVALDGTLVSAAAICIGVLIPVLPVAALAWIEPDPPEEA
jgi:peptidoglycan/LPS O-acetylase OafA/YrhL